MYPAGYGGSEIVRIFQVALWVREMVLQLVAFLKGNAEPEPAAGLRKKAPTKINSANTQ